MGHEKHEIRVAVVPRGDRGASRAETFTWSDFMRRLRTPIVDKRHSRTEYAALSVDDKARAKNVGGYVPGVFSDDARNRSALENRCAVTFDIDEVAPDLMEDILEGNTPLSRWEWFASTTRSHTPARPKWRIVIPLKTPVWPEDYEPLARIVGSKLCRDPATSMDIIDIVSFRAPQLMYWPAVSRDGMDDFDYQHNEGELLDPMKALDAWGDWQDYEKLPFSQKRGRAHDTIGVIAEDPLTKPGIIGAFCRTYSISEAIDEFLPDTYKPTRKYRKGADQMRYSYMKGSSRDGMIVYEDKIAYSHHGSDPIQGRATNAFDLVRIHKFGELDEFESDDPTAMESYREMRKLAHEDPEVEENFIAETATDPDEFEDLPPEEDEPAPAKERAEATGVLNSRLGDPDLTILRQSRVEPPAFPIDIFGKRLAKAIKQAAQSAAAPVDFVAAAVLTAASTAIGNSTRVQLREGWVQPAIIWAQIIGLPSSMKSPAMRMVTGPLTSIQIDLAKKAESRRLEWLREKEASELRKKAWVARNKAILENDYNADVLDLPDDCFAPPEPPRNQLVMNDATIEAFLRAQTRNPRGFMVFRDEIAGWLSSMERYTTSNSERPIWLESYDGGSYNFERVKDEGKVHIVHKLCASILGGIQPDRLLEITRDSAADDGLQARFIPFWPETAYVPLTKTVTTDDTIERTLRSLVDLPLDVTEEGHPDPFIMKFTKGAWETFRGWREDHRRAEMRAPTKLQNLYGKADGLVGRIALILECLWWAVDQDFEDDEPPATVSRKAVEAAIRFRETYIKTMQRRVVDHSIDLLEVTNARMIAEWIIDKSISRFNARQLRREAGIRGISGKTSADIVDDALAHLIQLRWIAIEEPAEKKRGPRPKNYIVNKRLWEIYED